MQLIRVSRKQFLSVRLVSLLRVLSVEKPISHKDHKDFSQRPQRKILSSAIHVHPRLNVANPTEKKFFSRIDKNDGFEPVTGFIHNKLPVTYRAVTVPLQPVTALVRKTP